MFGQGIVLSANKTALRVFVPSATVSRALNAFGLFEKTYHTRTERNDSPPRRSQGTLARVAKLRWTTQAVAGKPSSGSISFPHRAESYLSLRTRSYGRSSNLRTGSRESSARRCDDVFARAPAGVRIVAIGSHVVGNASNSYTGRRCRGKQREHAKEGSKPWIRHARMVSRGGRLGKTRYRPSAWATGGCEEKRTNPRYAPM